MKKKNIILLMISIIVLLVIVLSLTYAYFVSSTNVTLGNTNLNVITSGSSGTFEVANGSFSLNVTPENMAQATANNQVIASAETNLLVSFKSGTNGYLEKCSYDIEFEWISEDKYTAHSTRNMDNLKEFTLQASLSGTDTIEGVNLIHNEQDIVDVIGNNNSKTIISGALIQNQSESTPTIATWHIVAKFYNLNVNQRELANRQYEAAFKVKNVSCPARANATIAGLFGTANAGATGGHTGAIVEDHGIRYVGENPSNFIWFNCSDLTNQNQATCERWRIIGIFNEKYDTNNDNIPETEGNLVKIIRNDSLGSYYWDGKIGSSQFPTGSSTGDYGSNDWSDSQLMMMLNPSEFINSGYVNESDLATVHNWQFCEDDIEAVCDSNYNNFFRNMGSYFNSSLITYIPAQANPSYTNVQSDTTTFKKMNLLSQSMIATVKWYLTGPNGSNYTDSSNGLASYWYNYERNIDNTGYVYTGAGTRPKIWYGKVGLMYPSDFGYATGGASTGEYNREGCLNYHLYGWNSSNYQIYCAKKSWLLYSSSSGVNEKGQLSNQWTITTRSSSSGGIFSIRSDGHIDSNSAVNSLSVRPVLYLDNNVKIIGGNGSYAQPYILSL